MKNVKKFTINQTFKRYYPTDTPTINYQNEKEKMVKILSSKLGVITIREVYILVNIDLRSIIIISNEI